MPTAALLEQTHCQVHWWGPSIPKAKHLALGDLELWESSGRVDGGKRRRLGKSGVQGSPHPTNDKGRHRTRAGVGPSCNFSMVYLVTWPSVTCAVTQGPTQKGHAFGLYSPVAILQLLIITYSNLRFVSEVQMGQARVGAEEAHSRCVAASVSAVSGSPQGVHNTCTLHMKPWAQEGPRLGLLFRCHCLEILNFVFELVSSVPCRLVSVKFW